ncbi:hypothetical protein [Anditalea andensis]|nr:hypothetical protein [Anditalea andensis]
MEVSGSISGHAAADHFKSMLQQLDGKYQPIRIISFGKHTLQHFLYPKMMHKRYMKRFPALFHCVEPMYRKK